MQLTLLSCISYMLRHASLWVYMSCLMIDCGFVCLCLRLPAYLPGLTEAETEVQRQRHRDRGTETGTETETERRPTDRQTCGHLPHGKRMNYIRFIEMPLPHTGARTCVCVCVCVKHPFITSALSACVSCPIHPNVCSTGNYKCECLFQKPIVLGMTMIITSDIQVEG